MTKGRKNYQKAYEHALDRMLDLFKCGLSKEAELAERVGYLESGISNIASMCAHESEVIKLCNKLLNDA